MIGFDDRGGTGTSTQTIVVGSSGPPPAPTNLTATVQSKTVGTNVKTRIKLAWKDNATTESGYAVESCVGAGCTNFAPIANLAANAATYFDKSVEAATT